MPATSKAQRRLMGLAEHHPDEVYAKNKGVLNMSKNQLHDFAATKEKGMMNHVSSLKSKGILKTKVKK